MKDSPQRRYYRTEKGRAKAAAAEVRRKARRVRDPALRAAHSLYEHKRSLKRLYGITVEQYDFMFDQQNGRCAICESADPGAGKSRFAVDHDHVTGRVRGLLCNPCNKGLGMFQDSPMRLKRAAEYVV